MITVTLYLLGNRPASESWTPTEGRWKQDKKLVASHVAIGPPLRPPPWVPAFQVFSKFYDVKQNKINFYHFYTKNTVCAIWDHPVY